MSYLLIPIRLDALFLEQDRPVSGPMADFSKLPYWKKVGEEYEDHRADVPFLSEHILTAPFEDQGLYLRKGIHLHWSLPDTLTRSRQAKDGSIEIPAAPNRWLVTRTQGHQVMQWVVESDFLHPAGETKNNAVPYPTFDRGGAESDSEALTNSGFCPWRGLGRAVSAMGWKEPTSGDYLRRLTVLGWGDPNFAAFYPNCHSVFGFHDEGDPGDAAIRYEVLGWHGNPAEDILHPSSVFLTDAKKAIQQKYGNTLSPSEVWKRAVAEHLFWNPNSDQPAERTLYYAKLDFPAKAQRAAGLPEVKVDFALGNTGTEALSAYVASKTNSAYSARELEDRLEAVQLEGLLSGQTVDTGFKFREARHEKGFAAVSAGMMWSARKPDPKSSQAPDEGITLPEAAAHALNALNKCQSAVNHAEAELVSLRRRLYADWCLFQTCCYPPQDQRRSFPDPSQVQYFLTTGRLEAIHHREAELKHLRLATEKALVTLKNLLPKGCEARQKAAPRYWKPVDPVLLLAGKGIEPTLRHGEDGVLDCAVISPDGEGLAAMHHALQAIPAAVAQQATMPPWSPPWNPYLFEWEAEVLPMERLGNLMPESRCYEPEFITKNFSLNNAPLTGSDLICRARPDIMGAAALCSGRGILTPHASRGFQRHLAAWLLKHADPKLLPSRDKLQTWATGPNRQAVADRLRDAAPLNRVQLEWIVLLGWTETSAIGSLVPLADPGYPKLADDFKAFKETLTNLANSPVALQSQALSGFHQALLGQEQVFQLPLADPLGFPDRKAIVPHIAKAVAGHTRTAPLPLNDFLPLRTGYMRLLSVRLVDTFGQIHDVMRGGDDSQVTIANAMSLTGLPKEQWSWLPPRFCQAARVDFRWLSAGSDEVEMNAHPATSPICGWLLPNLSDHTLQVHGPDGAVLGILENQDVDADTCRIVWQPRPGLGVPIYPENIPDPTLQRVVTWIRSQGATSKRSESFLEKLLDALDNAMENIHPAEFKAHESLALLMGRPLAVVRASVGISLQGLPAAKHSWEAFRQDLRRADVSECAFAPIAAARAELATALSSLSNDGPALSLADTSGHLQAAAARLAEAAESLKELDATPRSAQVAAVQHSLATATNVASQRSVAKNLQTLATEFYVQAAAVFEGIDRQCDQFDHVKIPLRIGEWKQLNDGLAGFWQQDTSGELGSAFYGTQVSNNEGVASILSHTSKGFHIPISPADDPVKVVMLMDPRGLVHATTGVLPTKAISIPPDQYTAAMKAIQVFVLTTPIITPSNQITLPLPQEPGFTWSWLSQEPGKHWVETADLAQPKPDAHFSKQQYIREGWLRLDPNPEVTTKP